MQWPLYAFLTGLASALLFLTHQTWRVDTIGPFPDEDSEVHKARQRVATQAQRRENFRNVATAIGVAVFIHLLVLGAWAQVILAQQYVVIKQQEAVQRAALPAPQVKK